MKRSTLIIFGITIVVIAGTVYLNRSYGTPQGLSNENGGEAVTSSPVPAPGFENVDEMIVNDSNTDSGSTKTITMVAKQWEFQPNVIEVKQGDVVNLKIESVDVSHGIGIPDFGVNTFLSPGQTTDVTFVADRKGTFSFFCNVQCGSGHRGMTGTLIVD